MKCSKCSLGFVPSGFHQWDKCPECNGTGTVPDAPPEHDVVLPNGIRLSDVKASEEFFKAHEGTELDEVKFAPDASEEEAVRKAVRATELNWGAFYRPFRRLAEKATTWDAAEFAARFVYRARQEEIDRKDREIERLNKLLARMVLLANEDPPAAFFDSILCEWDGCGVTEDGDFYLKDAALEGRD